MMLPMTYIFVYKYEKYSSDSLSYLELLYAFAY